METSSSGAVICNTKLLSAKLQIKLQSLAGFTQYTKYNNLQTLLHLQSGYEKLFSFQPVEISLETTRTNNISVTILSHSLFNKVCFLFLEQGVLQVQIVRFGRSKSLKIRPGKDSSKTAVVSADMPPDSTRWLVKPCWLFPLRWLATVSSNFQDVFESQLHSLFITGSYNHIA